MITNKDITPLLAFEPTDDRRVLSIYLPVDQSNAAYINFGYESLLKDLLHAAGAQADSESIRAQFERDADEVKAYVRHFQPKDTTLVLFCCSASGLWWANTLRKPLAPAAVYASKPYLRPIIEALDEDERFLVVLTDRGQTRLFTLAQGELTAREELTAPLNVVKSDASGSDHLLSQMRFQHKADEHAHLHLKEVARVMDRYVMEDPHQQVIVSGTTQATAELRGLLSDQLVRRLAATISLPLSATDQQVIEAAAAVQEQLDREREESTLDRLITGANKHQQAVMGIDATVDAAVTGRIYRLIYARDYEASGSECTHCHSLFSDDVKECPHCGGETRSVVNLLDHLVERTAHQGGAVETMQDDAAERLTQEAGGIGALLRY